MDDAFDFEFTKDFRHSRPRAAALQNSSSPWGDRRPPMPTERDRHQFLAGEVPLLARVDERVLWSLAYEGVNEHIDPRTVIIREGDTSRDMRFYVVRSGEALVVTSAPLKGRWIDGEGMHRDADGDRVATDPVTGCRVLATLGPGDFFGESALLTSQERSATVRAGYDGLDVIVFDAQSFHARIAEHVLVFRMVRSEFAAGVVPDVRRLGLFNDLPLHDLSNVLHGARQEEFAAGDTIVTQGEDGDRFYIVLDGEVLVEQHGSPVARLTRGDYFGETALLLSIPRTATVRAMRPTSCWSITGESFELVMRSHLLGKPAHRALVSDRAHAFGGGATSSLADRLRRMA